MGQPCVASVGYLSPLSALRHPPNPCVRWWWVGMGGKGVSAKQPHNSTRVAPQHREWHSHKQQEPNCEFRRSHIAVAGVCVATHTGQHLPTRLWESEYRAGGGGRGQFRRA